LDSVQFPRRRRKKWVTATQQTSLILAVGDVFSSVARKYDTMNDIISLYTHRLWKDYFVRTLNPGNPNSNMQILDVAGGTGDIAFRLLEHATKLNDDTTAKVRVVDINEKMLKFGRRKVEKGDMQNWSGRIKFSQGNAETLEDIEDESVDLYTIAFGIRNVTHIDRVLKSAYRVLKPGGVFACLVRIRKARSNLRNSQSLKIRYSHRFIIDIRSQCCL
jgi:2-methoxy-6-polyprenyl-1,4-benzoquinol methylase